MNCSIEISMYPLCDNFEEIVLDFISKLEKAGLDYRVSGISTQIFGDYDEVWPKLGEAMKSSYDSFPKASFVIKVLSGEHKKLIHGY